MPSVSKIHRNIHKYARNESYKTCDKLLEYGKSIDFIEDKVINISDLIEGTERDVPFDLKTNPKDIFWHNHPTDDPYNMPYISFMDLRFAIQGGIKKIIATTKDGFTSVDFTTVKKSKTIKEMDELLIAYNKIAMLKCLFARSPKEGYSSYLEYLKRFAKDTGATLSNVKWSDYDKVRLKREP